MTEKEKKALSLLGFAARARRLAFGTAAVTAALREGRGETRIRLVIKAGDASPNTGKRLADRTAFYGVPLRELNVTAAELSSAVGKKEGLLSAVGVAEPELSRAILALFPEENNTD